MSPFSESQIEDLRELQNATRAFGAEIVIIGAMAYRLFFDDVGRETYDIDLAVALDLDTFGKLQETLSGLQWTQLKTQEQRWSTPRGNRLDLVPAGPVLRGQGQLIWPRSGFIMNLAGFDHVFRDASLREVGKGLICKVVPPPVLALLKMAAYLDGPERRQKDLIDLRRLMKGYEQNSDRIFSDPVFDAKLPDIEFAGAFLLGMDLRAIATEADLSVVEAFAVRTSDIDRWNFGPTSSDNDWEQREADLFRQQVGAFLRGLRWDSQSK